MNRFICKFLFVLFCFGVTVSGFSESSTESKSTTLQNPTTKKVSSEQTDKMKIYALRLRPGQDLKQELVKFTKEKNIQAGFIITCVGSLKKASIRLADQPDATTYDGKFEIVSLVGTMEVDGVHLHLSISDSTGKTIGGHLMDGCLIYTTAEIIIGDAQGLQFSRETNPETTYRELVIRKQWGRRINENLKELRINHS